MNYVCFLLGNSPACEFYMPTFRNTLPVPSSHLSTYEDGTECSETSAHEIQTPGNYPEESIQHDLQLLVQKRTKSINNMSSHLFVAVCMVLPSADSRRIYDCAFALQPVEKKCMYIDVFEASGLLSDYGRFERSQRLHKNQLTRHPIGPFPPVFTVCV